MTTQTPKPSIQHGDHNNSKKFRKSPSASNSEYPMGRREPADFIFPPSTSAWELSTFSFLLPKPIALHKQAAAILPAQTFVFSPFFFLQYVPWHEGNN